MADITARIPLAHWPPHAGRKKPEHFLSNSIRVSIADNSGSLDLAVASSFIMVAAIILRHWWPSLKITSRMPLA